jgi:hypothetical protein
MRNNLSETRQESIRNKSIEKGKGVKVDVYYKGRTYTLYLFKKDSAEFIAELRDELLKVFAQNYKSDSEIRKIIGFETINGQTELDYILSLEEVKLNFTTISLKPIICSRMSKTVSLKDFTFIKCLGSGGFSHVFLAKGRQDNRFYAVKLM